MELGKFNYFLFILPVAVAVVELSDFYPYGSSNGDTVMIHNDDGSSGIINIAFPFPFFDQNHNSLYVNTNGAISFLTEISQYTPDAFPLGDNRRLIAIFWADVDIRNGGDVFYRETQDRDVLIRVSNEIKKYFVKQRRFSAKWAMVVTWLDVAHYGPSNSLNNTFQTVIATDGVNSFSIFNYNKIEWTHGIASSGIPAQAGFNAGDGRRYFSIPNSRTPAIINITSTSNYDVPGKWIFQVDGETVQNEECSFVGGKLLLSPRSGIELGGTKVFINGPCFSPNDAIICRFNRAILTDGFHISKSEAFCITPALYIVGRLPIEVSLNNGSTFNFTGIFRSIPLGRTPPDVEGLNVEQWVNSSSTQLTWNSAAINTSRVDIEIFRFESVNMRLLDQSFKSYQNIPNTGKYTLKLEDDNVPAVTTPKPRDSDNETPLAIVRISPSSSVVKRSLIGSILKKAVKIFSKIFIPSWLIKAATCHIWYFADGMRNKILLQKLQEELPPCPTSLDAISNDLATFVADEDIAYVLSKFYHWGSAQCFRSANPSPSGSGQQCCYDYSGRLIVGPLGGGTFDLVSPAKSVSLHFLYDVLPWFLCCFVGPDCDKYYERRPSDDGSRYIPPSLAATNGDPHLVTFDGTAFSFNGHGEYILLSIVEIINFIFQGRMEPIADSQGRETKATALTALVVRETGSDTVQIELNARRVMDVFINGDRVDFDEQSTLDFTGVFVKRQNRSKLSVFFHSGVSIDVKAIEELLAYEISISARFKGKTAGLLGYWDDNKEKEFLLPNGSFIDSNSSSKVLHYEFGQKWIVNKNDTLFTYRGGKYYDDYVDPGFTTVFLEDAESIFSSSTLQKETKKLCGDNKQCMFDIAVSGKTNIGQVTLNSINNLKDRKRNLLITADPVFFGCDGKQNSSKTLDACGVCGGNDSTCTDCEGVVRPGVSVNNEKCVETKEKKSVNFFIFAIGMTVGLLIIIVIIMIVILYCCRCILHRNQRVNTGR